jgi:hypothetical protein
MFLENYWDAVWLAEVEMAASVGGADLCVGGTAIGYNAVGSPDDLFDNNNATECNFAGQDVDISGIGYEFTAGVSIAQVRWRSAGSGRGAAAPTAFVVQGSDDGTTWYTYEVVSGLSSAADSTNYSATVGSTARVTGLGRTNAIGWRVNITDNQSASIVQLAEVIFAGTVSGATLCTGGGATADWSFHAFGRYPSNAFDGNTGTQWSTGTVTNNGRIGYIFPAPTDAAELRMTNGSTDPSGAPKDFTVQYTEDGVTWTTVLTQTGITGWAPGTYKAFTL